MSYFLKRTENNLWHGKFSAFPEDLISHAVSTRLGGVGKPPFDSLNLALHVGDDAAAVIANRKKFVQSLGFKLEDIVTPNQVHGDKIFRADENYRGCGCENYADSIPLLCFALQIAYRFFLSTWKIAQSAWRTAVGRARLKKSPPKLCSVCKTSSGRARRIV